MESEYIAMIKDSVNYYEIHAEAFAASTVNVDVSKLYAEFEIYLKPGCRIMDLGCGSGRDSRYFVEKGYDVVAVDPSLAMCKKTRDLAGVTTYTLKAEELSFEDEYDAVWACASLLHVSRKNQEFVLQKICRALRQDGILYCSWKYGNQERVEDGRSFTDLNDKELNHILLELPDLKLIKSWLTTDVRLNRPEQKWLNVLLRKGEG